MYVANSTAGLDSWTWWQLHCGHSGLVPSQQSLVFCQLNTLLIYMYVGLKKRGKFECVSMCVLDKRIETAIVATAKKKTRIKHELYVNESSLM